MTSSPHENALLTLSRLREREHLCWRSSWNWGPFSILCGEAVGEDEELSHDGGDGDLEGFAVGLEALVEAGEIGIGSNRGHGGHVQRLSQMGASAADVSVSFPWAAIAGDRREADKCGDLPAVESAEFAEAGSERGSGHGTDARDRQDDCVSGSEDGIRGDQAI